MSGETVLWLVLRMSDEIEVMGIYSDEDKAVSACSKPIDVVGSIELDKKAVEETTHWEGAYYPLKGKHDD